MEAKTLRDDSIDFIRGTAVLLVIFGHYFSGRVRLAIFAFHIPLFLMISGYLCHLGRSNWSYLIHQIKRILPTYAACVIAMTAIDLINGGGAHRLLAGFMVYANPDMDRSLIQVDIGIGPIWFLPAMLVASFISYTLIEYLHNHPTWLIGAGTAVSIGGVLGKIVLLPFGIDNGFALVIFFVAGYLLCKQLKIMMPLPWIGFGLLAVGEVTAQLIGIQSYASRIYPKFPICIIASIAATYGYFVWVKHMFRFIPKKLGEIVEFIGKNSMTALFIHTLEFEFLLDSWNSYQIINISIGDQFIHGCVSCMMNYIILYSFIKIKTKLKERRSIEI